MKKLGNGTNKKWLLTYHPLAIKRDIPSLDNSISERIENAIINKILIDPFLYGLPLRGSLKLAWKLRVGDWRVIYFVVNSKIEIWAIGHRKDVYKIVNERLD